MQPIFGYITESDSFLLLFGDPCFGGVYIIPVLLLFVKILGNPLDRCVDDAFKVRFF